MHISRAAQQGELWKVLFQRWQRGELSGNRSWSPQSPDRRAWVIVWWMLSSFASIPGAVSNIREHWRISRHASIHARIFLRLLGHGECGEFTHVLFCIPFNGISVSTGKHFLYLMTPASLHRTSHPHSFPALSNSGRILLPSKQISLPPSFLYCPVSINSPTSSFSDLRHLSGLLSLYL